MASPFRKAKVEQAAIKMALYGPQGSGKTCHATDVEALSPDPYAEPFCPTCVKEATDGSHSTP
jgi:hypothetical protein